MTLKTLMCCDNSHLKALIKKMYL
uniref:Uncharacterized protein n=1 Tax=Anguilla anguilla TaxID=7936 RepID=A0A0E9VRN1_ANGAN